MNIWKEPYPQSIDSVLQQAEEIAELALRNLTSAPRLKDLFSENGNKLYRRKNFFDMLNVKPNVIHNKAKKENEFSGLYVFGNDSKESSPQYVGISNTIARRMRQHGWGTGHNQSSFAYLMAKELTNHSGSRESMSFDTLRDFQKEVQNMRVVVFKETDPYRMHFLEVAVSGILRTRWNTFKTH